MADGEQIQPPQALSQVEGEKLDNLDQNLWDLFSTTASEHPDHDAIVSMWQTEDDCDEEEADQLVGSIPPGGLGAIHLPNTSPTPEYVRWSYRELHHRSVLLSSWLLDQGCRPQDRVAAFLWNSVEWGLFFWASAKLRLVYMPLDPRLLASEGDFLVNSTSPRVVVAQDANEATALDKLCEGQANMIRIQCTGAEVPGWTSLRNILSPRTPSTSSSDASDQPITNDDVNTDSNSLTLIIFTSGTTSRPKGCLHTHRNLLAQIHTYDPNPDPSHVDRWLVHTPSCHIFAVNNALRAFKLGHAVIFPSKAFDISSTLSALADEQCTVMSAVPALVKAILANPAFPGKEKLNLRLVTIGGTIITPEDIRLCREGLGATHAIQAFGMSEGAPVISWYRDDELLMENDGYHPGVGRTLPGANIRICRPSSREMVARGELGELHIGGEQIVVGYLGDVSSDSFYEDETGRWLMTGDQAMMDEHGVLYISGRYKDLIIRAGENIPPLKLEGAIAEVEGVQLAQVVGATDDFAGQVPVAVVKTVDGADKATIKREIMAKCRQLGPMFVLDGVYYLGDLDMETFPVTSLGKIKKEMLRKAVDQLRKPKQAVTFLPVRTDGSDSEKATIPTTNGLHGGLQGGLSRITHQLAVIWEGLIGEKPGLDDSVAHFADSITILRFCDRVLNALDERLYLQDLVDNDTINKQAALLHQRSANEVQAPMFGSSFPSSTQSNSASAFITSTAPTPLLLRGSAQAPKSLTDHESVIYPVAAQAALDAGFQVSDIEDVLRIRENYLRLAIGTRPQSYHIRTLIRISNRYSISDVRHALEAGLTLRSIFRTILARLPDGNPFHIILGPSESLFDKIIQTATVPDQASRDALTKDGSSSFHSSPFMAQFQIITVQSPVAETIISATYNHSIVDAMSILPWHLDLERLLRQPGTPLPPSTPFKPFTELFHLYKSSLPAQLSAEYTVSRLRGISRFKSALWPPQRSPGWMICDDGCPRQMASTRDSTREQLWHGKWASHYAAEFHSIPRVGRNISLAGIEWLRQAKKIEPSLVMKCAIAVFNILQTGSEYAVFNTIHAGRSWPFVPDWMAKMLPPAMSIAGPTTEWSLELCRVDANNETVGTLLTRMKDEHEILEKHCHVPWEQVLEGLGGGEESQVAEDATFRQAFVWDVSIGLGLAGGLDPAEATRGGKAKAMEVVGRYDWPDCGLFWNAFMVDRTNLFFIANWDTAQMNLDEVEGHCNTVASILRQLVKEANWDRRISDVFSVRC
ncbi:hypothetical protein V8F06_009720 [Rhypophila decipiens]